MKYELEKEKARSAELLTLLKKVEGVVEFYGGPDNFGVDPYTKVIEEYRGMKLDTLIGYKARSILPEIRKVLEQE
jgi:hypothetical protein